MDQIHKFEAHSAATGRTGPGSNPEAPANVGGLSGLSGPGLSGFSLSGPVSGAPGPAAATGGVPADVQPAYVRSHSLSGRIRMRARLDAILIVLLTVAAAYLGHTPGESMIGATAALSLGILFYVIRRDRDLSRFARHERWRDRALEGKGVSLAQWKAGAPLEPWPRRETAPDSDRV